MTAHEAQRNNGVILKGTLPVFGEGSEANRSLQYYLESNDPFRTSGDWMEHILEQHERIIRQTVVSPALEQELSDLAQYRALIVEKFPSAPPAPRFILQCDDFASSNILVDQDFNMCLVDWEFTYAAPKEYSCLMASWLISTRPYEWTQADCDLYSEQLEVFLQVLEEVEGTRAANGGQECGHELSQQIREGWVSGVFWLVLCAKYGLYFDRLWARFMQHKIGSDRQ